MAHLQFTIAKSSFDILTTLLVWVSRLTATHGWFISTPQLLVEMERLGLTAVPQDINTSLTHLSLAYNSIASIDSQSFHLYPNLRELNLNHNPVVEIKPGTLANNAKLELFTCSSSMLSLFPEDLGLASKSLTRLWFLWAIRNITAFSQMRLDGFTSLFNFRLWGNKATDVSMIKLPSSITALSVGYMKLEVFLDISATRFPILSDLNIEGNNFPMGSNFNGVSKTLSLLRAGSSNMFSAEGVEYLPNLAFLKIDKNNLETLPDLLLSPKLKTLYINDNSRMNCDQRMCWRRLWDRVRTPLQNFDDVKCSEPPLLAGHYMLTVNPKFMQCSNGKLIC